MCPSMPTSGGHDLRDQFNSLIPSLISIASYECSGVNANVVAQLSSMQTVVTAQMTSMTETMSNQAAALRNEMEAAATALRAEITEDSYGNFPLLSLRGTSSHSFQPPPPIASSDPRCSPSTLTGEDCVSEGVPMA